MYVWKIRNRVGWIKNNNKNYFIIILKINAVIMFTSSIECEVA